MDNVYLVLN